MEQPKLRGNPLTFFKEVRTELSKVVWPTKKEAIRLTTIVILISLAVGFFISSLDYVLTTIMGAILGR